MSNGGSILDGVRGLFSSGGGTRDDGEANRDPAGERMERVEQIASGVEMAAAALADEMSELRREAVEATDALLESARGLASGSGGEAETGAGGGRGAGSGGPGAPDELARCVDVLEELHYRLLRVEVHPEVQSEEERDVAADRAREAVDRVRELADSLPESAAA